MVGVVSIATEVELFVPGKPVPQGSKSYFRGHMVESASGLAEWRRIIRLTVRHQLGVRVYPLYRDEPVYASLVFTMPRVQRRRSYPHVKPDLDKLVRAVFDALTGLLFADDANVVSLTATKVYGDRPGVRIRVGPISD